MCITQAYLVSQPTRTVHHNPTRHSTTTVQSDSIGQHSTAQHSRVGIPPAVQDNIPTSDGKSICLRFLPNKGCNAGPLGASCGRGPRARFAIKAALEYERAYSVSLSSMKRPDKTNRWNRTDYGSGQREGHVPRLESLVSTDMEVDNVTMQPSRRKDNSKIRCYNRQKLGHIATECRKPKKKISGQAPPSHQNNLEV
ncbi:hypothetical protein DYB36_012867 [Aphanomyces astaci]|uniref:CCHC-type domain-containing protein n=1 Tax=Aphanomyces astaci TaxID=112090 RepID=A0A397A0A5_APHAT|nr:hypothetical protein DYB36_012867 [Aphanomyces astaci]